MFKSLSRALDRRKEDYQRLENIQIAANLVFKKLSVRLPNLFRATTLKIDPLRRALVVGAPSRALANEITLHQEQILSMVREMRIPIGRVLIESN